MILQRILQHKEQELKHEMQQVPLDKIKELALLAPVPRDFTRALRTPGRVNVIAEVKRRSPSKGLLCPHFDHLALARSYAGAGAAAISVLTDSKFFGGHRQHLADIRRNTQLPLLRKDFIIAPYQVYQARALGADAVLLIAAVLDDDRLPELCLLAESLGMAALVEVHDETELQRALAAGAKLIGINNRDLHTFETDIATTFKLRRQITEPEITVVSESGIKNADQMAELAHHRVHSVLVGETLVAAPDPAAKLSQLLAGGDYRV
ncbi:indole-3-glycerol phosphate synthase [Desulfohalotomaculum tongense]|uniref:indole-3-glycerol phosphate synthase TrpC n=1 Tax=Desulforadius tongensis TaxID=1216062 RepID=UPI00195EC1F2|nr:indole-3-glycerol phosphate synthase TrpC [Desulforadius tongensis]MBM7854653.1 indole-3-glycerol phosphate synthase [Desulforadius tongensis]